MTAGHVIETPVIDHLTFQVLDSSAGTPVQRYAWTGEQDASSSTLRAGSKLLRTNLATDPKVRRPAAHTATGFRADTDRTYMSYRGNACIRWERVVAGSATIRLLAGAPVVAPAGSSVNVGLVAATDYYGPHTFRLLAGGVELASRTVTLTYDQWTLVQLAGTVPADSSANITVEVTTTTGTPAGEYSGSGHYVSALTVELGTAGDPFDGDTQDVPAIVGEWRDLADKATSVSIRRGAQQKGAGLESQVGTLDAELVGAIDLGRVAELRPNTAIRVIRPPAEPALVWDLQPRGQADTMASQAFAIKKVNTVEDGTPSTSSGVSYPSDSYLGYTDSAPPNVRYTVPANSILIGTPNDSSFVSVPTNPKPVGAFDAGDTYVLRANVRSTQDDAVRPVKFVLYTGNPIDGNVIAESKPWTPPRGYSTDVREWSFVAPKDDGWQIGLATAQELTLTGASTSVTWTYAVSISGAQVWDTGRQRPEFTGTISDLNQTVQLDKSTGEKHTFTAIQAVDAVQSLANTDRYGVLARSGAGYQSWAERIDQLAESSRVPIDAPVESDVLVYDQRKGFYGGAGGSAYSDQWAHGGKLDNDTGMYVGFYGDGEYRVYPLPNWEYAGPYATTMRNVYVGRTLAGLDTDAAYTLVATVTVPTNVGVNAGTWRFAFDNGYALQYGPAVDLSKREPQTVAFTFGPGTPRGTVGLYQTNTSSVAAGGSFTVKLSDMRVLQVRSADPYVLQDVAYESTLLNHFDLACNSVGARWYVTKRGAVLFRRAEEDAEPGARFTDTAAGDVSYTDVALGYDTRNVVNSIKLNQHGYDPATGNAADTASTYTDDDSIARWGSRAAELDTCLYLSGAHQRDGELRARELMAGLRQPTYAIQSFTFNAQSDPTVLDAVELRSTVAIDYENLRQRARVLSIDHAITPTRWMVTVTVNEPHVGARFRDVNRAGYATFADLNTALAGKSFGDVDGMPFDPQETP